MMEESGLHRRSKIQIILQGFIVTPIALMAILLISAGRWDYWQAWCLTGLSMILLAVNLVLMRNAPDVINERLAPGKGGKNWDKLLVSTVSLLTVFSMIIGGLDSGRYGWSPIFNWLLYGLFFFLYILGQALFFWSMKTNRFFSSLVRIQKDRDHKVCQEGPYQFVRHPGYLGWIIYTILTPLILGSLWGLIPQGMAFILMLVRTQLEDDTLRKELPRYIEYTNKVKYRLVPGIW
jgi:protein-S-isoprenylcysteine O-methyltransferase Ste14